MSKWSLSAHQDTKDMDMEDMVDTDTTTAKRLPKKLPTMSPLSPPSISLSPLPTPPPRRSVLTNPSPFPLLPALISLRKRPSKSPPLSTPRSLLPTARLKLVSLPAKRLSSPSPNKSVSNLSTDTPMSLPPPRTRLRPCPCPRLSNQPSKLPHHQMTKSSYAGPQCHIKNAFKIITI